MSLLGSLLISVAGLTLLTLAADRLVVSASRLSLAWGLSPILVGAVVVGLGTSLPEFLTSALAALRPGGIELALGNVIGSNIANLALVLGTGSIVSRVAGLRPIVRREGMAMLAATLLLAWLAWDGTLGRSEGIILVVGMLIAVRLLVRWAGETPETSDPETTDTPGSSRREILVALGALAVTLAGARLFVEGAVEIAGALGVSDAVIGLTLVAVGTSLPELATTVAAARRGSNELLFGNVLGSNLFNALGVAGLAALIGPGSIGTQMSGPIVAMLVVTTVTGIFVVTADEMKRWEGGLLVASYPALLILGI